MSSPGRIGRQLFPHGESDVRHVSVREGWAQLSRLESLVLLRTTVFAWEQLLLFAEK